MITRRNGRRNGIGNAIDLRRFLNFVQRLCVALVLLGAFGIEAQDSVSVQKCMVNKISGTGPGMVKGKIGLD